MKSYNNLRGWVHLVHKFLMGTGAVLLFGLVLAGCVQEVTGTVGINYPQIAAPSVTAKKTTDGKYLILTWKAVSKASGYTIYAQQKDKVTVESGGSASNKYIYSEFDGTSSTNLDVDKYSARISLLTADVAMVRKDYRFGVQANANAALAGGAQNSGISWTSYYTYIEETGGGGGGKIATLSTSASYSETVTKLNEIISYCNANPTSTNTSLKASIQTLQSTISSYQSIWSSMGPSMIVSINGAIAALE
jgi:hypothetical protein